MAAKKKIPCAILRGGTSRGVYFLMRDIEASGEDRDQLLLEVMGSPDKKQIDGLGGATSVTSKVAMIAPSDRPDADVDYTFAQVSVDKAVVSTKGNCGNISSGVGPFAIERGLVQPTGRMTTVRIYNTNTGKLIYADVCTEDGGVRYEGDFAIAGVPGTAAPVRLRFIDPAGSMSGKLLPTGNRKDVLDVPGLGRVTVSIVDVTNPLVFVKAADVGMTGRELPADIDGDPALLERLEAVRGMAAVKLGYVVDYRRAAWDSPGVPKMTVVSSPADYTASDGSPISAADVDLVSRMMSMQKAHPSYAMTGAMCTVAAAAIEGTVVSEVLRGTPDWANFRIGHASGILPAGVVAHEENGAFVIDEASGFRTANLLMDGFAFYHGGQHRA